MEFTYYTHESPYSDHLFDLDYQIQREQEPPSFCFNYKSSHKPEPVDCTNDNSYEQFLNCEVSDQTVTEQENSTDQWSNSDESSNTDSSSKEQSLTLVTKTVRKNTRKRKSDDTVSTTRWKRKKFGEVLMKPGISPTESILWSLVKVQSSNPKYYTHRVLAGHIGVSSTRLNQYLCGQTRVKGWKDMEDKVLIFLQSVNK